MRAYFARSPRELALMETMLSSARVGEALALRVRDVWDFARSKVIEIVVLKGEKGDLGSLLLTPQAIEAIGAWLKGLPLCPDAPAFPSGQTREALSECQARRIFKQAFADLGMQGQLSTHAFRKTYCRIMADAGKSHLWLKQAGRWRSLSGVEYYVNFDASKQAQEIADVFSKQGA